MPEKSITPPQPLRDDSVKAAYSAQPGAGTEPPFTRDKTPQRPAQRLMGFTEAIVTCLKKYATFKGRATRAEFWWFFFFCLLGLVSICLTSSIIGNFAFTLSSFFFLAIVLPLLAVTIRRLHDTNHTGWCIPMIIFALFLVSKVLPFYGVHFKRLVMTVILSPLLFLFLPSGPANEYGDVPCTADSL